MKSLLTPIENKLTYGDGYADAIIATLCLLQGTKNHTGHDIILKSLPEPSLKMIVERAQELGVIKKARLYYYIVGGCYVNNN